jgi:hypothetical protein
MCLTAIRLFPWITETLSLHNCIPCFRSNLCISLASTLSISNYRSFWLFLVHSFCCVSRSFCCVSRKATYQVETGPPVQTWKLLIWATRCWSKGAHGRVEGGICKSVIRSGRLNTKLSNPPPLGSTSCGLDSKFPSLHRWSGFHLIHCHLEIAYIYVHSKSYVPRKAKTTYNLKRKKYVENVHINLMHYGKKTAAGDPT